MELTTRDALEGATTIIATRKKRQQDIYNSCIEAITTEASHSISVSMHLDDIAGEIRRAKEAEMLLGEYGTMLSLLRDIMDIYEKEEK